MRICAFIITAFVLLTAPSGVLWAQEWDVLVQKSLGRDAIDAGSTALFSTYADTIIVNGSITSLPTRARTYDRSLVNYTDFNGIVPINPRLRLRLDLMTKFTMRNSEGSEEPRKITRENWAEAFPKIEAIFLTQNNLELFLGGTYWAHSKVERRTETSSVETVSVYSGASALVPHIGILKRTGGVEGGFYYKAHGEKGRSIRKVTTQDDTELHFNDVIYDPTTIALYFQTALGNMKLFAEFAAVQGSDGGNRAETGEYLLEDYLRVKTSLAMPLTAEYGLRFNLAHKTLSYADNRNVSIPTIPMTSASFQLTTGRDTSYTYVGLLYAYGKDGQSLPEFNAEYEVQAYGLTAGLRLAL